MVAALALVVTLVVAGCGSTSLSAQQLHTGARRVCRVAIGRLNRIPTPQMPTGGSAFLRRGIAILTPEVTALQRLHPGGSLQKAYARAVGATRQELGALDSALKGLKAGNDPVVAIKTLQQQLLPLEQRSASAWAAAGVAACSTT